MSTAAFAGSMAGSGNGGLPGHGKSDGHINTCLLAISTDLGGHISTALGGNINTCLLVMSTHVCW